MEAELNKKINALKKELKQSHKQIVKQQETVTKPLIQQVAAYQRDKAIRRDNQKHMSVELRILMAILNFP